MAITPGIHEMPWSVYLGDPCPEPSLSASIARMLCLDSPAHAREAHPRLNPQTIDEHGERLDIGTAAHALLLEGSSAVAIIDAADFRSKAAKDARDAAYARGHTPLLAARWTEVQLMVAAAREQLARHVDGGAEMFTNGWPEQTLIWQEDDVWCRARLDWLRPQAIDDYKTTGKSANPETWTRSLFYDGKDLQVAWYLRGLKVLTGQDAVFRFAVQETYRPYALSVIALGPDALMLAEKKVLYALERWREARGRNEWTGYPRRTCYASLPPTHESWWLEREMR
jgi:hypothetical protein